MGGIVRKCYALVCLCMRGVCVTLMAHVAPSVHCVRGLAIKVRVYVSVCGGEGVEYSIYSQIGCVCILFAYDSWLKSLHS